MYGKMPESWFTEAVPLICTFTIQGQYPVLSPPESPWVQGAGVADGGDCRADCLMAGILFPSPVPSGLTFSGCNVKA